MKTKVRIFSDIHWEHDMQRIMTGGGGVFWSPVEMPDDKDTVLILAGDLWNSTKSIVEIQTFHKRFRYIVVVLGNHDYWTDDLSSLSEEYMWELNNRGMTNVILLDRNCVEIDDKIFVGCTLFTNMDNYNPLVMLDAPNCMYPDFKYIANEGNNLTATAWLAENKLATDYINIISKQNRDKEIIVVTHYGPSTQSIHEKYKKYGLSNYFFVSNLDQFILDRPNIKYWFHGHVHDPMDYTIGECRVLANPRGYPYENLAFDEEALYEL